MITPDGWFAIAKRCPSPNFNQRPLGQVIDLLVIHNISLPPGEFGGTWVQDFFLNRLDPNAHPYFESIATLKVSAHLFINRAGEVTQFVSLLDRAWHAGVSCFEGRENCNDYSIGIELEGTDDVSYTKEQYETLVKVTALIQQRFPLIKQPHIVGHSDIAPTRKTDPGAAFDWAFYRQQLDFYDSNF